MITEEDINNVAKRDNANELGKYLDDIAKRVAAEKLKREEQLKALIKSHEEKKNAFIKDDINMLVS